MNDNKVFVSYASTNAEIARRIIDCLKGSYPDLWFDEHMIVGADNIILEINTGLANSLMGIVILSDDYFQRKMTMSELSAMFSLMRYKEHFRIWPLLHEMSHEEVGLQFPFLGPIRGDHTNEGCESLRSKFEMILNKTRQLISVSVAQRFHPVASNDSSDESLKDIDPSELSTIYNDLTNETSKNRKSAAVERLTHYSESRSIWKHDISWGYTIIFN